MTLEELKARNYEFVVLQKNGQYFLRIPELCIFSQGNTLDEARQKLEAAKLQLFESALASSAEDLPLPRSDQAKRTTLNPMLQFLFKSAIVGTVCIGVLASGALAVQYAVMNEPRKVGFRVVRAAVKGVEDFAEKGISTEREEFVRNLIRGAVPKLKPFVDELRPLFDAPETTAPGSALGTEVPEMVGKQRSVESGY